MPGSLNAVSDTVILGRVSTAQMAHRGILNCLIDIELFEGGVFIGGKIIRKLLQTERIKETLGIFQDIIDS